MERLLPPFYYAFYPHFIVVIFYAYRSIFSGKCPNIDISIIFSWENQWSMFTMMRLDECLLFPVNRCEIVQFQFLNHHQTIGNRCNNSIKCDSDTDSTNSIHYLALNRFHFFIYFIYLFIYLIVYLFFYQVPFKINGCRCSRIL